MIPYYELHYVAKYGGILTTGQVAARVDTPDFMYQTELEAEGLEDIKFTAREWPRWAWPGCYPLYYMAADGGCLCVECANQNQQTFDKDAEKCWHIVAVDVNYEDHDLYCDHCNEQIEAAYDDAAPA